jgi:GGDEF domain-containing protein
MDELVERPIFQARLRQELARSRRFGHPFVLVVLEAHRGNDSMPLRVRVSRGLEVLRKCVREYDFCHKVFEDTLVAALLETDQRGAKAALQRLTQQLAIHSGPWSITLYPYPEQEAAILKLPALVAA